MNLLVVEDSLRLGPLLVEAMHGAGYSVDLATTAKECLDATRTGAYDLFIIDLGLPDQDGARLISHLRSIRIQQPILIITARAGIEERVFGLDIGADDYLVKPFNTVELLARVRALLRRPAVLASPVKQVGRLTLDLQTNEISCNAVRVDLTRSEHRLLALFIRRGDRIVTTTDIEQLSREFGRELSDNGVQQAVSRLRKHLAQLDPDLGIQTIRGSGYALCKAKPDHGGLGAI
jgi:two-component system, OmpR family, response regulator QseB